MNVLLPAPLGPSRPMDRPVSLAFSFFRMVRSPKRTSRLSNSITGSIPLFKRRRAFPCSHELRERDGVLQIARDEVAQTHAHQVAAGGHADAVRLSVGGNHRGFHVA